MDEISDWFLVYNIHDKYKFIMASFVFFTSFSEHTDQTLNWIPEKSGLNRLDRDIGEMLKRETNIILLSCLVLIACIIASLLLWFNPSTKTNSLPFV